MRTLAKKLKPTQPTTVNSTADEKVFFGQNHAVQRLLRSDTEQRETGSSSTASGRVAYDFRRIPSYATARARIQAKSRVGAPGDIYEREADRVSEQVLGMPEPKLQSACSCRGECPECQPKQLGLGHARLQTGHVETHVAGETVAPPLVDEVLSSPGKPLDTATRAFFEPRFGFDFSHVGVHTDEKAAASAHAVNARAYTFAANAVFGADQYAPRTQSGRRLLGHELAHVVQQSGEPPRPLSSVSQLRVQRTLGDGHDLTSPRFSRLLDLEAAYDDESVVENGSSGRGVQAIQQALYDLGYPLPTEGADGEFRSETKAAVKAFQRANPPLDDDGEVGPLTMTALDTRFGGAPALPAAAVRAAAWDADSPAYTCVRSILCPWSPHTMDVLRTRITLKSFDSISWVDERWDGTAWVSDPFPGGGYNTGTEIGVLNSSCEDMSETLYHEVLHANSQPLTERC